MKNFLVLTFFLLSVFSVYCQDNISLSLKSGEYVLNIENNFDYTPNDPYRIVIFKQLPTDELHQRISESGINLIDYLPRNMYVASINNQISRQCVYAYA